MSARKWPFRLTSVRRLVQAAQEMGLAVSGVTIGPDGSIHIETSALEAKAAAEGSKPNSFDQVLGGAA
jgi:hypothetical protein